MHYIGCCNYRVKETMWRVKELGIEAYLLGLLNPVFQKSLTTENTEDTEEG